MKTGWTIVLAGAVALTDCAGEDLTTSSTLASTHGKGRPTVSITNGTCNPGPCAPFEVRGWIAKFAVPGQPPAGFMDLGPVTDALTCLRLPAAETLTVIGFDEHNTPQDTMRSVWTAADPIVLVAAASPMDPIGRGIEFTPARSAGWSLTLPGGVSAPIAVPSAACAP
jgi:hypothetical protein